MTDGDGRADRREAAPLHVGQRLEVRPSTWGFGGEAIVRRDAGWLVVAHAIPGETVIAEVVRAPKRPGGAWRARTVQVINPSEDRRDPRCPHYDRCPGCQLRHVSYDLERSLKRRSVRDALERFGGGDPATVRPVHGAPSRDGYRVRGAPSARTAAGEPAMAPFPGSGPPIPQDQCPVMRPATEGKGSDGEGWTLPNPDMRARLTDTVRDLLGLGGRERVVEVGAGRGALTVACAPAAAAWVGLDVDPAALEAGRAAVDAAGLSAKVELRAGRLEKVARKLLVRHGGFDVALLNPMRKPLGWRVMAALEFLGVRRCVYVGPSPMSTARDLARLPMTLRAVTPVDLYPGTYHVLVVALAEVSC